MDWVWFLIVVLPYLLVMDLSGSYFCLVVMYLSLTLLPENMKNVSKE